MAADEARTAHHQPAAPACIRGAQRSDSHFGVERASAGWLTRRCQTTAQMPFGVRRDPVVVGDGHEDAFVRDLARVAAVAADHTEDGRARLACRVDRPDEVDRHPLLDAAASDREDQHAVALVEPRSREPRREDRLPPLVVRASGQLRHVVGRRVCLDAAQLPEVAHRV